METHNLSRGGEVDTFVNISNDSIGRMEEERKEEGRKKNKIKKRAT